MLFYEDCDFLPWLCLQLLFILIIVLYNGFEYKVDNLKIGSVNLRDYKLFFNSSNIFKTTFQKFMLN